MRSKTWKHVVLTELTSMIVALDNSSSYQSVSRGLRSRDSMDGSMARRDGGARETEPLLTSFRNVKSKVIYIYIYTQYHVIIVEITDILSSRWCS